MIYLDSGIACAITPVALSSLPSVGTVTVSGTLQIGAFDIPFGFRFTY